VSCSLDSQPVGPDWLIIWMRWPDSLGRQSWLHDGRRTLCWRPCGLRLQVWDLVLDRANMPSSLVASLSAVIELLEGRVDAVTANKVC
jgi:hypothetical protein